MSRTIFIGDVHGCSDELYELVEVLQVEEGKDQIYLTGDAFTKGPDPLGVWEIIQETRSKMVLGNHDVALLEKLRIRLNGKEKKIKLGHKMTLDGVMSAADALVPWLENLPLYIETEHFLLVHAGINPLKELEGTSHDEFISIRTWPPQKGIAGKRWHDYYTPVRPVLVFGHDAPGGLVLKSQQNNNYLVGLDSGCVYGRELSAYVLENQEVIQVKSRQPEQVFD